VEPHEIEAIERATVTGVGPLVTAEIGGWLVPLGFNPINRGRSAVPLRHDLGPKAIPEIEAAFAQRGLPRWFRIADAPRLDAVRRDLAARGYVEYRPTFMEVADAGALAEIARPGEVLQKPDASWAAMFGGEGFDAEDSALRVEAFGRSADTVYGAVHENGRTLAVGVAGFCGNWASISGMRTAPDCRGRGLAGRILAAFGVEAKARGVDRIALQVEADNPGAQSVYRRAGFSEVWSYSYWRPPY
jgi:ribosomal protein S18 acetylase RimI-like enzyme